MWKRKFDSCQRLLEESMSKIEQFIETTRAYLAREEPGDYVYWHGVVRGSLVILFIVFLIIVGGA